MKTTKALMNGINALPGMYVLGEPDMSVFAFTSNEVDIFAVGDEMEVRGWNMDRQQRPNSLHLMITPIHSGTVDQFLSDLRESVDYMRANPSTAKEGTAPMYGMMASVPDRGMVRNFVLQFMEGLYET